MPNYKFYYANVDNADEVYTEEIDCDSDDVALSLAAEFLGKDPLTEDMTDIDYLDDCDYDSGMCLAITNGNKYTYGDADTLRQFVPEIDEAYFDSSKKDKGHWYGCSECHYEFFVPADEEEDFDYCCPKCHEHHGGVFKFDEEELVEKTVKQGNYWVNKGKEGSHGKMRTKKAADAQRRAMFANGYMGEKMQKNHSLTEDKSEENTITNDIISLENGLNQFLKILSAESNDGNLYAVESINESMKWSALEKIEKEAGIFGDAIGVMEANYIAKFDLKDIVIKEKDLESEDPYIIVTFIDAPSAANGEDIDDRDERDYLWDIFEDLSKDGDLVSEIQDSISEEDEDPYDYFTDTDISYTDCHVVRLDWWTEGKIVVQEDGVYRPGNYFDPPEYPDYYFINKGFKIYQTYKITLNKNK